MQEDMGKLYNIPEEKQGRDGNSRPCFRDNCDGATSPSHFRCSSCETLTFFKKVRV